MSGELPARIERFLRCLAQRSGSSIDLLREQSREGQATNEKALADLLARRGELTVDQINQALADICGIEVREEVVSGALDAEIFENLPYAFVSKHLILPLEKEGDEFIVAVADPLNIEPLEELRHRLGAPVRPVYCNPQRIAELIHHCYETEEGAASQLIDHLTGSAEDAGGEGEVEIYDLLDDSSTLPAVVRLLNLILTEAIQQRASDIHFEPHEEGMRVRYRIDGVLQRRHSPASEQQGQLLTRIKVMAKLDIAERRLPQDGRIKLRMGNRQIDFRVSTIPVTGGERIVLRILDKGNVVLGFDQLGMLPETQRAFRELAAYPEGILLVTGPTGSGKTTTLYSVISDLQNDQTNIMTVEDPVEYNLKGIAQIGVRPKIGLTFSAGLRHILRQDPDVILIGEIRDTETAEIAIQSALTGHLVLSTLHTNDAPSAVTRLVDMGIEPYLISSSLIGVVAQRLVRRTCDHCLESYQPTEEELHSIGMEREELEEGLLWRGLGCDRCWKSGYIGRLGIYELMRISSTLQQQIATSPDAGQLRAMAREGGMKTLKDHGIELIKQRKTTIAEVLRVTRASGGISEG